MITKNTFVKIMDELDAFFNGEVYKALEVAGMAECAVMHPLDKITDAIDVEVDPKDYARKDPLTKDCGSYIFAWLFGPDDINEKCKTAEELYDYIMDQYENSIEE